MIPRMYWGNSVVPPGLEFVWGSYPALKRWAKLACPCGTRPAELEMSRYIFGSN